MILGDSFARCCTLAVALSGSSSFAEDYDLKASRFGMQLGLIIGAAEKCGYSLDDDAISALVAKEIPAENLDFAGMFQIQIDYNATETDALDGIELRLRCETAQRSAEALGLMAP